MQIDLTTGYVDYSGAGNSASLILGVKGQRGGKLQIYSKTATHTIVAGATSTETAFIPDGAIVLSLTGRVLTQVVVGTDRTNLTVGDAGSATRFATKALTSLALAVGTTFSQVDAAAATLPLMYAAAGNVVFGASGGSAGDLVSGVILIQMFYLLGVAPTA